HRRRELGGGHPRHLGPLAAHHPAHPPRAGAERSAPGERDARLERGLRRALVRGTWGSMTPPLDDATRSFADDVRRGLSATPKALPPRYFYDALGSHLFEAICQLPWYPITRTETRQLERHAPAMVAPFGGPPELVELGSGSGEKLAILLRALEGRAG